MTTIVSPAPPNSYFRSHTDTTRRNTQKAYLATSIRKSILAVFEGLGGYEGMLEWARQPENQTAFYTQIVPKLLPAELSEGAAGAGLTVIVQRAEPTASSVPVLEARASSVPGDEEQEVSQG